MFPDLIVLTHLCRLIKTFGAMMGGDIGHATTLESSMDANIYFALKNLSKNQTYISKEIATTLNTTVRWVLNIKTIKDAAFEKVVQQAIFTFNGYPPSADKGIFCQLTWAVLAVVLLKVIITLLMP